jgi:ABC-type nitrate/sulfonate/bicarbonate transport system substrate-binding protein
VRLSPRLIGLLTSLALVAAPLPARVAETLHVIVFPGGFSWPIWAAQGKGFFAREGLEVNLTPTPSSMYWGSLSADVYWNS